MHCICLAWANSRYFCTTTRIIRLLGEVANLIIDQVQNLTFLIWRKNQHDKYFNIFSRIKATKYLDVGSLFEGDIDDNIIRMDQTLSIAEYFRETFENFRQKIGNYFKAPAEPIFWTFHQKLIFSRLIKFEERLKAIQVTESYFSLD